MPAEPPPLILITGIMAAGKSTVAAALSERFEQAAHVRGDLFRRSIVTGRVDMAATPSDEALRQLRLRYRLAADVADGYVDAGFATVVQDTVIGPMLAEFVAMFRHDPAVIVLTPTAAVAAARDERRTKTGYTSFTPAELDTVLRTQTPRLGSWIDNTTLTVNETVDEILATLAAGHAG